MVKPLSFIRTLVRFSFLAMLVVLAILAGAPVSAAIYDAGPGETYPNLGSVPWTALAPGDMVNIHYQPGGYHEIILLSQSGTSGAPITINGVPDPATGTLPVIDGQNAVTATNVPWSDLAQNTEGVVVVGLSAGKRYGYIPAWIVIQNLQVQNAYLTNSLVQANGITNVFDFGAAAIYVEFAQHFTIQNCVLTGSANGFYCGSENDDSNQLSAAMLVQNSWIHDNGDPNNYDSGNINSESRGMVIQYNLIGPMRAGAVGDQVKDRSSGTVLAYNQVIDGPIGTAFWFSQTTGGVGIIDADPAYRTSYVYGNVFYNPSNSASGEMFRYDTLDIEAAPRNGTLYFYNNTVVNYASQAVRYGTALFCLPVESEVQQWNLHDVLDCRNNIFASVPVAANGTPPGIAFLNSDDSTVNLGTNWISPGFQDYQLPYQSNLFFGTFTGTNQFIVGKSGQYNPGFVSVGTTNFQLVSSSPAIDTAGSQSPVVLGSPYNPNYQYVYPTNFQVRVMNGLRPDLGAFEGTSTNVGMLYSLVVSNGLGGGSYLAGATVPITASNVPSGEAFAGWTGPVPNPASIGNLFTMPASNLVVTAIFTNVPVITNLPGNYPLTVINGTGSGSYAQGAVVVISASNAPAGEIFAGWTGYAVGESSQNSTTLTMPAAPVTVTATYQVSGSSPTNYYLTVGNGTGSGLYTVGTVVAITANSPPPQEIFTNWTGYPVANNRAAATAVTMPAANISVTANYVSTATSGGGPTNAPFGSGPTNPILFVTQVPVPNDFTTIASTFGNQQGSLGSCGRGGDLYIRYPGGGLKNLTRAAGYGQWGQQAPAGIAVRQPSVYWSGQKAVFSMVVGTSTNHYDPATYFWQLYEITNFMDSNAVPVITKVPNQPTNYNNIAPIYGSDDRIIFTSDRPRNGQAQLYPQLDEYEEAQTVTGIWSLQPTNGDLFMINHTPSGAFSPLLDSAGRIIFSRWDHLQRDQQADTDWEHGYITYGAFNWSDESSNSVMTTNLTEEFPEPRNVRTDLLAGTDLAGNTFNQFFPWAINQDGTDEETVNHIGRHEIGGSYGTASFTNDPNLYDLYNFTINYNTNSIHNFLEPREDPNVQGLFYGVNAPEFGTHGAGQLVSLTGNTNLNAFYMRINYLTPLSTEDLAETATNIPSDDTGLYRNPLMTSDGYMIAAHTTNTLAETGAGTVLGYPTNNYLGSSFDFRLKFLQYSNGYYAPFLPLTSGLTNYAQYIDPNAGIVIVQTNNLWEFDPVEVMPRVRPVPFAVPLPAPEQAAFAAAKVDVTAFKNYLNLHQLALIVSRDVTTRDEADHQQPFNLSVAGSGHQTIGAPGKIYDVAWLQMFQADQLRGLNLGHTNDPGYGRRVLAQYMHDPAVDNPTFAFAPTGAVQIASDGSQATIVPARRAMSWQLTDTNGVGIVRERYWLTFAAGEIRSCTSCHGINEETQAGAPAPTNTPLALVQLLQYWKSNTTILPAIVAAQNTNYFQLSFIHRPAEPGVTYHVQATTNFLTWTDVATYSGSNSVLTPYAREVSRQGSPNETVTVRDVSGMAGNSTRFWRVSVTRP